MKLEPLPTTTEPQTPQERVQAFARELDALTKRFGVRLEPGLDQVAPMTFVAKLRVVPAEG